MKAEKSRAPYYVKLHLGDYARDADHLSLLQEGAYLRLMRWYYSTARPIPNDLERIYRRCMASSIEEQHAVRIILEEFFVLDGPVWKHKRIEQELAEWLGVSDQATSAIKKRWGKTSKKNNATTHTDVIRPLYQPEPEPEPIKSNPLSANADGEREKLWIKFWTAYPKKEAKQAALKAWKKLKSEDTVKLFSGLARAMTSDQWQRGIIPHPATWLNGRRWEDEGSESNLGMCMWNLNGSRGAGGRCSADAVAEENGLAYCSKHKFVLREKVR